MALKALKTNLNTNVTTRVETFDGNRHLVVPATILVEGVHNGLYYSGTELEKFVEAWNGIPIPVLHPKDNEGNPIPANSPNVIEEYVVGTFFNAFYEDGKLKGEAWLDIDKTKEKSPEVLDIIHSGGNLLEISTGLFLEEVGDAGIWNTEDYYAEAVNFRPEHLALLPGSTGACSVEDGCGIRDNNKKGENKVLNEREQIINDILEKKKKLIENKPSNNKVMSLIRKLGLATQEISHDDIHYELQSIVDEMDRPATEEQSIIEGKWHYVREVFDNYFIYSVYEGNKDEELFKQNFIVADDDKVELDGNAILVKLKTEYIALTDNGKQEGNAKIYVEVEANKDVTKNNINEEEDNVMCCENKVKELISNDKTRFTDNDLDWLVKLEEDQIDSMFPIEEVDTNEEVIEEEIDTNKEETEEVIEEVDTNEESIEKETEEVIEEVDINVEEAVLTVDEYIANAPKEIQDALKESVAVNSKKRLGLIDNIMKIKTNKFTKEQLEVMDTATLENIASLADVKIKPDYSANSIENEDINNNENKNVIKVREAPKMKWNEDGTPDYSHLED